MSQQQLLFLLLAALVVGITIAVGIYVFKVDSITSNRDAITDDLYSIAADAYEYAMRPATMGGGDGVYDGYQISLRLASNDNGSYTISLKVKGNRGHGRKHKGVLTITGTSSKYTGSVTITIDDIASVTKITYTGEFQ